MENIEDVLKLYVECFFSHEHDFARRLAAESLAFLLRRLHDPMQGHSHLLNATKQFIEDKDEESRKNIIESLGLCLYHEMKNAVGSLRRNSDQFMRAFLQCTDDFVFKAFLVCQRKTVEHCEKQYEVALKYISQELPSVDATLCGETMCIWMVAKEGVLINDRSMYVDVLAKCWRNMQSAVLCEYIRSMKPAFYLDNINMSREMFVGCALKLINDPERATFIQSLSGCDRFIDIVSSGVLEAFVDADDILSHLLMVVEWLKPDKPPQKLIEYVNNMLPRHRFTLMGVLPYIHNRETYELVSSYDNLNLREKRVYYSLMSEYELEKLPGQLPIVLDMLGENLMTEDGLLLVRHLVNVSYRFHPDWMHSESNVCIRLLNMLDFNDDSEVLRALAADIMAVFIDISNGIHTFRNIGLLIKATTIVFRVQTNQQWMRDCEVVINRLAETVELASVISQDTLPKLFNIALGICKQKMKNARERGINVIKNLISIERDNYGPKVSAELRKTFPWTGGNRFYGESLLQAVHKAAYIDSTLVSLVQEFCSIDVHSADNEQDLSDDDGELAGFLIRSVSSVQPGDPFADVIRESAMSMLKSVSKAVREAAFELLFRYQIISDHSINEQKREKVKMQIMAYVSADGHVDDLMRLELFSKEYFDLWPFVCSVVVNLSVGLVYEYLTVKKGDKKKFKKLAGSVLQSLGFLSVDELAPLFKAIIITKPSPSHLRKFPRFLIPMLSRIPEQLRPYLDDIAEILVLCLNSSCRKEGTRGMKAACRAVAAFMECFDGFEELGNATLVALERLLTKPLPQPVRMALATACRHPHLFADHPEVVNRVIALIKGIPTDVIGDLFVAVGHITAHVPFAHEEILSTFSELLGNTKLFKRETVQNSFMEFLRIMKEKFVSPEFQELSVRFLVNYQRVEAIPIVSGLELTKDQFNGLCTMIAYPLLPHFRSELVPLIAESLGEYAEPFRVLNSVDLFDYSEKTRVYGKLETAGDFAFVFALQCFADLQINNFSLRSAAVGFLCRVIAASPSIIEEFILPSIEFHLRKRHSGVPPNEIIMIIQEITKTLPDLLPSFTIMAQESWFLSLGSIDPGVRSTAMEHMHELITSRNDWSEDEMSKILMPLLCQLSNTPNVDVLLSAVCEYCPEDSRNKMLKRLVRDLKCGSSVALLVAMCKAGAFSPESVKERLIPAIEDKKIGKRVQLQLIVALLAVDRSYEVVHHLIAITVRRMISKKPDVRELGQDSLIALVKAMDQSNFFVLFQDLRNNLKQGYEIPLMYVALNNMISNAQEPGVFDSFIEVLAETLFEDLFGHNANLRKQYSSHVPEAKKCCTFDTFLHLASNVTFNFGENNEQKDFAEIPAWKLIQVVIKGFDGLSTLEQIKGAQKLISFITEGFTKNETVDPRVLCYVVDELLHQAGELLRDREQLLKRCF